MDGLDHKRASDAGNVLCAQPVRLYWHVIALGLMAVAVWMVFGQVTHFQFLGYDDPLYVGARPSTRIIQEGISGEGLRWIWTASEVSLWEPLTYLSHMLDVELFGVDQSTDGGQHHVANLLLHFANMVLAYVLGMLLFGQPLPAFFGAMLFGLHPMRAESVGWISERKGLLCAFFMLLAICAYVQYSRSAAGRKAWYWLGVGMTLLAMMSKPAAIAIPLLIGLLDIYPLRRCGFESDDWRFFQVLRRQLREKWPFVLAAAALMGISLLIQYGTQTDKFIGAMPLKERLVLIPAGVLFYLQRTFWPRNLSFEYPAPSSSVFVLVAGVVIVSWTVLVLMRYRREPGIFFAWGWMLISLLPVCGLAYVGTSFTTDRYTYFAHIGFFPGLTLQVAYWLRCVEKKWVTMSVTAVALVVVSGEAWICKFQTSIWRENEVLFRHAKNAQPLMNTGFTNLATHLNQSDPPRTREAIKILEDLKARREQVGRSLDYTTLYNMGVMYGELADGPNSRAMIDKQMNAFEQALQDNPRHALSLYSYGKRFLEFAQQMPVGEKQSQAMKIAHTCLIKASEVTEHSNPLYLNGLAESCMVLHDWERASQCVNRALALPVDSPRLKEALIEKRTELERMLQNKNAGD